MRLRTVVTRAVFAATGLASFISGYALGASPGSKVPVEIWGLEASDDVTIDGVRAPVRAGGGPRVFAGDPAAANAPVLQELAPGRHELSITRQGCAPRNFPIHVEGSTKRAIVIEPTDDTCSIPDAPPRR